jgi:hypothetical protein
LGKTLNTKDWHTRLSTHFRSLRARRRETGNHPIFALEHGLTPDEVVKLKGEVQKKIRSGPTQADWLAWVIYAAELGYCYTGLEYWQTFENDTPGWYEYGDRDEIRDYFKKFASLYNGFRPLGPWAEHFSIIAWPITHAILPTDLQEQLARKLYEIRHAFRLEVLQSPDALGQLIASHSDGTSARFQKFLEDPPLVGRIAAALLSRQEATDALILPSTLQRITTDLEQVQTARSWLQDARSSAQKAQLRGLITHPRNGSAPLPTVPNRAPERERTRAMEAEILLRPSKAERWDVVLEVPDLSSLLEDASLRDVLRAARCQVAGSTGRPLARGLFLAGIQHIRLERWPQAGEELLRFNPAPPEVNALFRTEYLLRRGPIWVFQLGSDGSGSEVRGKRIRPGRTYILVQSSGSPPLVQGAEIVKLSCAGVQAVLLTTPAPISSDLERSLRTFGLSCAQTVTVWPAGLPPARWDGDGYAEWLSTDIPCVGIKANYRVSAYTLSINQALNGSPPAPQLTVRPDPQTNVSFVQLDALPVGQHRLSVTAHSIGGEDVSGELHILIRAPRAWKGRPATQGIVKINLDPNPCSMEELWEGKAVVEVLGPERRKVMVRTRFWGRNRAVLHQVDSPHLDLPISAEVWRKIFSDHVLTDVHAQRAYDDAFSLDVEVNAQDLGTFRFSCERTLRSIRWQALSTEAGPTLELTTDENQRTFADVSRYSFDRPDNPQVIGREQHGGRVPVCRDGGLYLARIGNVEATIIAVPLEMPRANVTELRPLFGTYSATGDDLSLLVSLAEMWANAPVTGAPAGRLLRSAVLRSINQQIFAAIGGPKWNDAELAFSSEHDMRAIESLRAALPNDVSGVAIEVMAKLDKLVAEDPVTRAVWVHNRTRGVWTPAFWLAAFWLAAAPEQMRRQSKTGSTFLAHPTIQFPGRMLLARFLVLAIDRHLTFSADRPVDGYEGWEF